MILNPMRSDKAFRDELASRPRDGILERSCARIRLGAPVVSCLCPTPAWWEA